MEKNNNKKSWFRCFFGLHQYRVKAVYDVISGTEIIGRNYVLQCNNCGKLKTHFVRTQYPYSVWMNDK
jgi:hypothetical protein